MGVMYLILLTPMNFIAKPIYQLTHNYTPIEDKKESEVATNTESQPEVSSVVTQEAVIEEPDPEPEEVYVPKYETMPLGMNELVDRFKRLAKEKKMTVHSWKEPKKSGTAFTYNLNEHYSIVGSFTDDDVLDGVMGIGTGDGTLSSGADIFLTMYALIQAVHVEQPLSKVKEINNKLITSLKDNGEGGKQTPVITLNHLNHQITQSPITGVMLTIWPVDANR